MNQLLTGAFSSEMPGPVTGHYTKPLLTLDMMRAERMLPNVPGGMPGCEALLTGVTFDGSGACETGMSDSMLRRLWGEQRVRDAPSASTFSCAFKGVAESQLPARLHAALVEKGDVGQLVGLFRA